MSSIVVEPTRADRSTSVDRSAWGRRPIGELRRLWWAVTSRVYLPACAVAVVAVVLVGVGWSQGWGGSDFGGSVTALRSIVAGPVTLAIIGVFLVVERTWPAQERPLVARGHRHDLIFAVVTATLLMPLVTALTLSFAHVARTAFPWIVVPDLPFAPRWAVVGVIVVAMDACNWAVHLANHRVRVLWRFHELHHSQEDMSALTVFRTHPLIHVSYLAAAIPGLVLVANGAMTATVLVVYAAIVAFAHSNTRLGFGPLERVFVSPNYHRIHHMLDGPQDVNLGFALTVWDQLFHRAVFPTPETVRAATGLPGRPLVVEQEGPRARHVSVFLAQLVAPFRPMHDLTDLPPVRAKEHAR
jgi:sterol desaturase/sphingolipid hydroxylase (fatty acid hydroxylase superfamily)